MKKKICERFEESPTGLFKSLIGKPITMLKSTAIDNLKMGNFDAYGRLFLVVDNSEILEFETETKLVINTEYNITKIGMCNLSEDIGELQNFPISQPFILNKILIYGELLSFVDVIGNLAYDRLDNINVEKENTISVDTEDIIIFESTGNRRFMLLTPQAPYFQIIFDEHKIVDIITKWEYPNLGKTEKVYKFKRAIT